MANTDLGSLDPQLEEELGGEGLAPDALRRMNLLRNAVAAFNGATANSFDLTGTTLDREATPIEGRAVVLVAALMYLRGKAIEASGMAIRHTNVAGTTDLQGLWKSLEVRIKSLRDELCAVMERLTDPAIAGEVVAAELGETKDLLTKRPLLPMFGWDGWWW